MSATLERQVTVRRCRLALTTHAVERYIERVKPLLTFAEAMDELVRLLPLAELGAEPAWALRRVDASGWVVIADSIAFPVVHDRLVTCLTRSETGAELRIVREPRGDRERRRRKRQKKHGKVAREERRRTRAAREAAME